MDQNPVQGNENKIFAVISYLWILCIIPLLLKKDDEFVLFHARQGLILFIAEVALGIISIIPFLGGFVHLVGGLVCAVLSIAGIIQVLKGNKWEIPVVYEWSKKINI